MAGSGVTRRYVGKWRMTLTLIRPKHASCLRKPVANYLIGLGYCRTRLIGSRPSGTRCQLVGSLASKRQKRPAFDRSTSSPRSRYQADGPKPVTKDSQPGLSLSAKASSPAAALVNVMVHTLLPEPRTTLQSPAICS